LTGMAHKDLAPNYEANYLLSYWAATQLYLPYQEESLQKQRKQDGDSCEYIENDIPVKEYKLKDDEYIAEHISFDSIIEDWNDKICLLEASPNVGKTVAIMEMFECAIECDLLCYVVLPTKSILYSKMKEYERYIIESPLAKKIVEGKANLPSQGIMIWDTFTILCKSWPDEMSSAYLLFDEVHDFVNAISYRTTTLSGIGKIISKKTNRLLLATATPLGECEALMKEYCVMYRYVKENGCKYILRPVFIEAQRHQHSLMSYVQKEYEKRLAEDKNIDCILIYDNHHFNDWCDELSDFKHFCASTHPLYQEEDNTYVMQGPYQTSTKVIATQYLSEGIDLHYRHPIVFVPMNEFISMYEVIQLCHRFRLEHTSEVEIYLLQSNNKRSTKERKLQKRLDAYNQAQVEQGVSIVKSSILDKWGLDNWTPLSVRQELFDTNTSIGKWHQSFMNDLQVPVCAYMSDSIAWMMKNMGDMNCRVEVPSIVQESEILTALCPHQQALLDLELLMANKHNQDVLATSGFGGDESTKNEIIEMFKTCNSDKRKYKLTSQFIDDLSFLYSCHYQFYYDALSYSCIDGKIDSRVINSLVRALKSWKELNTNTEQGSLFLSNSEKISLERQKNHLEKWLRKLRIGNNFTYSSFSYRLESFVYFNKTNSIEDIIGKFYKKHKGVFIFTTDHFDPSEMKVNHSNKVRIKDLSSPNQSILEFNSQKECQTKLGWTERECRMFFKGDPKSKLKAKYELMCKSTD